MNKKPLILLALLGACAEGPASDLQYIKQARSIAAEWALVNEESLKGSLTPTYVDSMRHWLHDGLRTAHSSLSQPDAAYAREIKALLAEAPDAAPDRLQAHAQRLKKIEDGLESA